MCASLCCVSVHGGVGGAGGCFGFLKLNQTNGASWLENVENVRNIFICMPQLVVLSVFIQKKYF